MQVFQEKVLNIIHLSPFEQNVDTINTLFPPPKKKEKKTTIKLDFLSMCIHPDGLDIAFLDSNKYFPLGKDYFTFNMENEV